MKFAQLHQKCLYVRHSSKRIKIKFKRNISTKENKKKQNKRKTQNNKNQKTNKQTDQLSEPLAKYSITSPEITKLLPY